MRTLDVALLLKPFDLVCVTSAPPQHFRYLNIVDTSTSSKILVSTRISGLIKNSVEVPLSLLSIEESIEMLAFGAGLDSETYPNSLVEVAKLCGERR